MQEEQNLYIKQRELKSVRAIFFSNFPVWREKEDRRCKFEEIFEKRARAADKAERRSAKTRKRARAKRRSSETATYKCKHAVGLRQQSFAKTVVSAGADEADGLQVGLKSAGGRWRKTEKGSLSTLLWRKRTKNDWKIGELQETVLRLRQKLV